MFPSYHTVLASDKLFVSNIMFRGEENVFSYLIVFSSSY